MHTRACYQLLKVMRAVISPGTPFVDAIVKQQATDAGLHSVMALSLHLIGQSSVPMMDAISQAMTEAQITGSGTPV